MNNELLAILLIVGGLVVFSILLIGLNVAVNRGNDTNRELLNKIADKVGADSTPPRLTDENALPVTFEHDGVKEVYGNLNIPDANGHRRKRSVHPSWYEYRPGECRVLEPGEIPKMIDLTKPRPTITEVLNSDEMENDL